MTAGRSAGVVRLALALSALAVMVVVTVLAYDMGNETRRAPLARVPMVLMPAVWVVAAAALVRHRRGWAAGCVGGSAAAVALLALVLLVVVGQEWALVRSRPPRPAGTKGGPDLVLYVHNGWALWAQAGIGLAALAAGLVGWWRGRKGGDDRPGSLR